jgi:hypothetical protein
MAMQPALYTVAITSIGNFHVLDRSHEALLVKIAIVAFGLPRLQSLMW